MARPFDGSHVREERPAAADRSLGELFSELSMETTTLVRQEVELAKTELTYKATEVGKDVGFLLAGSAVAYAGFLALIAAAIIALAHAVTWWVSALLVGLVVAGLGAYLVFQGLNNLKTANLAPKQTIESLGALKETVK